MWHGFKVGRTLLKGMGTFMRRHGYQSLEDLRGIALQYFTSEVPMPETVKASIDPKRCKRCGQCLTACRDGAYDAIRKRKTSIDVERELCDGCGLCLQVCPEEAIRLNLVRA
jgi:dihydropyrimidine dehydrogenase (NAD+) subunit PreA